LISEAAGNLYRLLGVRYDFALLDTPALLAFTDAAVVAARTDGVVLAARYADVDSNDLESAVASLRKVEARILGSVFTFSPVSEPRRRSLKRRWHDRRRRLFTSGITRTQPEPDHGADSPDDVNHPDESGVRRT
jgi:Mrp family chromosome partitioning ATPase